MANQGRIACLDGLRALSIALVLLSHLRLRPGADVLPWIPFSGPAGVGLFFIISGYLITTLLLDERDRHGTISLLRFYARRGLRILPPAYLFLAAAVVLRHAGYMSFTNRSLVASLTYWRNYLHGGGWSLDHMWSLSIEEQFYLLWPFVMVRLSDGKAALAALAGVAVFPILRLLMHGHLAAPGMEALDTVGMDAILFGCLLALAAHSRVKWIGYLGEWRGGGLAAFGGLWILYLAGDSLPSLAAPLVGVLRNFLMTWLLWWCVCNPSGRFGRILESRPLVAIGAMSYSIYLWQQVFLNPDQTVWFCQVPQNLVLSFIVAGASYHGLERPLLRLRRLFAVRDSVRPEGSTAAAE